MDLNPVAEVENILILSQLGVETGRVAADLLLGKAYPSGKLTTSWAAAEAYPKIGEFGDMLEMETAPDVIEKFREVTDAISASGIQIAARPDRQRLRAEPPQGAAEQVADAVAAEANKIENLYDRLKFIYSWISDNCTYDAAAPDSQDIESFFINKVSACAGYSHALQYIANKAGIPCIYITGPAKTNGHVEHHAWNAAAIGGTTVYLDVTWGDRDGEAPTDYTWLGLTLTDMSVTHTPDYPELVPDADDPIYEYWAINGGGFDGYDADAVFSFLESDIAAGKESTSVRFSSAGAMDECHLDYTASTIRAEKLLKDFPGVFTDPEHVGVYSVYKQDGLNSVTFVWHR